MQINATKREQERCAAERRGVFEASGMSKDFPCSEACGIRAIVCIPKKAEGRMVSVPGVNSEE